MRANGARQISVSRLINLQHILTDAAVFGLGGLFQQRPEDRFQGDAGAVTRQGNRLFGRATQGRAQGCWKKSLPLLSTTMKAGKSSTSIFQTASMPKSSKSMQLTFLKVKVRAFALFLCLQLNYSTSNLQSTEKVFFLSLLESVLQLTMAAA